MKRKRPARQLNRNLMAIVALVGSIHVAIADEASDAVQVLSKLWTATSGAKNQFVGEGKAYQTRMVFVGDGKTYKMRVVFRENDGTVEDSTGKAPFRLLEEDQAPMFASLYPPSSVVGVRCLFGRDCIQRRGLKYDPVYNPKAQPEMTGYMPISWSYGVVNPADAERVRRALHTLLRLNAAPPFEPPDAPR